MVVVEEEQDLDQMIRHPIMSKKQQEEQVELFLGFLLPMEFLMEFILLEH
jgi:hypothetical protein